MHSLFCAFGDPYYIRNDIFLFSWCQASETAEFDFMFSSWIPITIKRAALTSVYCLLHLVYWHLTATSLIFLHHAGRPKHNLDFCLEGVTWSRQTSVGKHITQLKFPACTFVIINTTMSQIQSEKRHTIIHT